MFVKIIEKYNEWRGEGGAGVRTQEGVGYNSYFGAV